MGERLLESHSDAALVIAVAGKSEPALEELFSRHAGQLRALARRVVRDDALASDVVQEVFVRLWQRPDRFDPARGSLKAFLLADAHGRSVDIVRSEVARRAREARDLGERLDQAHPTTDDEAMSNILSAEVRDLLAQLGDDERRAIELAYFEGHSYRDVAVLLDEPEGTVKSRIRTGLAKLRALTLAAMAVIT
ncbi:MAG: sigma-70 family RNA polymerase sigma factor [Gaiellales bacterium]